MRAKQKHRFKEKLFNILASWIFQWLRESLTGSAEWRRTPTRPWKYHTCGYAMLRVLCWSSLFAETCGNLSWHFIVLSREMIGNVELRTMEASFCVKFDWISTESCALLTRRNFAMASVAAECHVMSLVEACKSGLLSKHVLLSGLEACYRLKPNTLDLSEGILQYILYIQVS